MTSPTGADPRLAPPPRERRHTLYFLEAIRDFSPVFLDTEVDATRLLADRAAARAAGQRRSVVGYLLVAAGGVLARHPAANSAYRGGPRPRVAAFPTVSGKVTLDRTLGGTRVVLSTVVPEPHTAGLAEVQRRLDRVLDGDPAELPEFAGIRALHRLSWLRGRLRFARAARDLRLRPLITGTFAVTSLGHRPVDGFHSVGGTTVTLGVGRIVERPVVRDGAIVAAPVFRLSLAFDHRVIDGAEAADVLTEIRAALEEWPAPGDDGAPGGATGEATTGQAGTPVPSEATA
ncbi:2-oxo acid dehydrogenase subunit E2 [Kitasatospora sp. NPDC059146]|uniref:2-oxo acid dehydrogenase subunit E2 n=1 Tax=unclassified Kitasatospora TaxID=2633591 RepID=UPI00369458FE